MDGVTFNTPAVSPRVGFDPLGLAVNQETYRIFVVSVRSGLLLVVDGATRAVRDCIFLGGNLQVAATNPMTNRVYIGMGPNNTIIVLECSN